MRIRKRGIIFAFDFAFVFVGALGVSSAAFSQTKPAAPAAKAPSSVQARDLSGVWYDDHPRPNSVTERFWIYKFAPDEPPMTPWGQAQFDAAKSSFGSHPFPLKDTNDPVYNSCAPPGFPRVYLHPFPFQIIQSPTEVILLFEYDSTRHQIYTDGRAHDTSLGPLWNGDSIGHWEGDTLVTDTVNFNDKTWLDRMGHPHSEQLHVIERIHRMDHDHLEVNYTFDDPKAYTKPWTARLEFRLYPKWTIQEYFCEDENTFQDMENNEVKPLK
jgi:hypothetical protein